MTSLEHSPQQEKTHKTLLSVLVTLSCCHFLTDTNQSLVQALYPLLKKTFHITFFQIGLITLTMQLTGGIFQPIIGFYTDRYPKPFALSLGMTSSLSGLILLSLAGSYAHVLCAVALIGFGAAVFHPEASRIAHMASGGRHGLAQSVFQIGGNTGTAFGPLLAATLVVPYGRTQMLWLGAFLLLGIIILQKIGIWFQKNTHRLPSKSAAREHYQSLSPRRVKMALGILIVLIFSKYFYLFSMISYYTFFLMNKFHLSIAHAQYFLFFFLFSIALGTLIGGPLGDRFGRKRIIWVSILGTAPFSILLPYASLVWIGLLSCIIGLILASAFSAILIYAQELMPGNVGMVSGLFFGLAFGMGGFGSVLLGALADVTSINFVFYLCSFLPLIGIITAFLPSIEKKATDCPISR
ncbi:MAG: MFS transporter [Chthoniobacterales bacterium]|nr:MFS transporter [Chthoniobacterales bacterium]